MPSAHSRAELVAELAELHSLQLKTMVDATFVGWTDEQLAARQKRYDRISVLQAELNALDATSGWSHSFWS